ncbi:hypothetical protein M378DRAFT_274521 [Amanita muscaria Koide BX008]|uniref:Uncharacterized protein n=1 Tax=Amanita muscaria (strain Koide BX008) TaxID=946122 RepID=A0A0C2X0S6_AMAMK|nr:hypothetical protein M378DRAFT_274521 [Amanita muscaria Koide BX008]
MLVDDPVFSWTCAYDVKRGGSHVVRFTAIQVTDSRALADRLGLPVPLLWLCLPPISLKHRTYDAWWRWRSVLVISLGPTSVGMRCKASPDSPQSK